MHGKGEFSKIKGHIFNTPMEAANIGNILPRPAISSGFIVVKLKRNLKYMGHRVWNGFAIRALRVVFEKLRIEITTSRKLRIDFFWWLNIFPSKLLYLLCPPFYSAYE